MADGNHIPGAGRRDPSTFDHPPVNPTPYAVPRPNAKPGDPLFMAPFEGMGARDAAHRQNVGKPRYIVPTAKGRMEDLQSQMVGLHDLKPVLKSRYMVKGWLDREAFSVLYGESNVGKTFLALDLAMHVASGEDWHGIRVNGGNVVYIAGEGGSGINNRIEAMRLHYADMMQAMDGGDFILMKTALDLCGATDAAALCEALKDDFIDPILIIIDTLAMAFGSGDENTAKDMGAFVQNCRHIRTATGAHVMVIHHSGKDTTKGARGSGSLRGASDTEIELTRDGEVIVATQRKQRDMQVGKPFAYTLKSVFLGNDEDGDKVFSAVVLPTEAPAKRPPRLKGQALIAMQAFSDAVKDHGVTKGGEDFPTNRKCVSLEDWREACDRHSLSAGEGDSSKRTAFHKAWKGLQERGVIRVLDGFAWRVAE
ncbi:MAG: AAA family ATPase [Rhodobacteraceae bacterium]|nr:AAA family ATPase [Paracoccaceae bacterium]